MATSFPKFGITLTSDDEEIAETGVKVTVRVEISVEKTSPSCIVKKNGSAYYAHALLTTSDGEYIECVVVT